LAIKDLPCSSGSNEEGSAPTTQKCNEYMYEYTILYSLRIQFYILFYSCFLAHLVFWDLIRSRVFGTSCCLTKMSCIYVHGVNTIKCESSYILRRFDFRSSLLKQKIKLNILWTSFIKPVLTGNSAGLR
jgi:hypothetical protein